MPFRRAVASNQTLCKPTRTGSLAGSIVEHLALGKDGELVPLTPGSTERVAQTVTHAGIVKTRRFSFLL